MIDLAENIEKLSDTELMNLRAVTLLKLAASEGPRRIGLRAHLERIEAELKERK